MASRIYYFSGKAKWAKVYDFHIDPEYGHRSIDVYLDDKSLDLFKNSGSQLKLREDDEGKYVSFRRDHMKVIKGEEVVFGPPTVLDSEGTPMTALIGNGSDVVVKVTMYDYNYKGKAGVGTRLDGVRVDNLVEYEGGTTEVHTPGGDDGELNDVVPF